MGRPNTNLPLLADHVLGVTLYNPTSTNPSFRLDFVDPITGQRCQTKRRHREEAEDVYYETVAYVRAAAAGALTRRPEAAANGRPGVKTVNDLFDEQLKRWAHDNRTSGYIEGREGMYDYRIAPEVGHLPVRKWAASTDYCRDVLSSARAQGLSPATVENYGTLMRGLVTLGWELRWISPGHNPMSGVPYRRKSKVQGEAAEFVHERDRPDFEAVEQLIVAYDELAEDRGIPWLAERALVGGYGGARPGERDALRICDLHPADLEISICQAFEWSKRDPTPRLKSTKNGKERSVPLPRSVMDRLVAHADRLRAAGAADDAFLFTDPKRPDRPLSLSTSRRLHIEAALRAGWETVAVRRSGTAKRHLGPDHRPRHTDYSLRHHAASWMHDRAGFDWADVSRYLGHHSVSFTQDVYVRSGAGADARNRERMRNM